MRDPRLAALLLAPAFALAGYVGSVFAVVFTIGVFGDRSLPRWFEEGFELFYKPLIEFDQAVERRLGFEPLGEPARASFEAGEHVRRGVGRGP